MQNTLGAGAKPIGESMRIRIAGQEQRLKEQHARGPHGWRAAKPGQEEFGQQELHCEEEESAKKDRETITGGRIFHF